MSANAIPQTPSPAEALTIAEIAIHKLAENVQILDLHTISSFTDYFVIATGSSSRQLQAIAKSIEEYLPKHSILSLEGMEEGRWILIDAGSVVVHLFLENLRSYYHLEQLWQTAPQIPIPGSFYNPSATRES